MPIISIKRTFSSRDCSSGDALAGKKEEGQGSALTNDVATYSRDASDGKKIQYISKTYGVPREAIMLCL